MDPIDVHKKRSRDDMTDAIVSAALGEEQRAKKAKKAGVHGQAQGPRRGMTLAEIEREEGGPVKVSMVPMAQTKRRMARSKDAVVDADELVEETERYEQALQVEEEDGIKFEPFNLKQEREEGFFDEEGNYVERKNDEDDEKDAWLASDAGQVVSEAVRSKLTAQQRLLEAAEAAAPLSEVQIGTMKGQMAALMLDGETVMQALKRLGAAQKSQKAMSKREKQRLAAEQAAENATGGTATGDLQAFLQMTELASTLLSAGELDIYSCSRRQLEREAALYMPAASAAAPAKGGDDMFGDDDDDIFAGEGTPAQAAQATKLEPAAGGGTTAQATTLATVSPAQQQHDIAQSQHVATASAAPAAVAPSSTAEASAEVDYSSWPIKELRRFLLERGQDSSGVVEKADLVARVQAAAAQGPEGGSAHTVPLGYAFDPASGYFYNAETGMYYDSISGAFCEAASGKWYTFDSSTQQFVAWTS